MSFGFSLQHEAAFTRLALTGEPTLAQFLLLMQLVVADSASWPHKRVLVDLRGAGGNKKFTEQFTIGREAGRMLAQLKIASVVPEDRITRVSERAANRTGGWLKVFTSEASAIDWLLTGHPED